MTSPLHVTAEFTWSYTLEGAPVADFDCRATARVRPGEPCRPWQMDPGSGPEVEGFTDIEVASCYIDNTRQTGRQTVYVWHQPDDHLRSLILAYLDSGAEDTAFEEAAQEAGRLDPDYRRDLLAGE